jgi:hypothetical protein
LSKLKNCNNCRKPIGNSNSHCQYCGNKVKKPNFFAILFRGYFVLIVAFLIFGDNKISFSNFMQLTENGKLLPKNITPDPDTSISNKESSTSKPTQNSNQNSSVEKPLSKESDFNSFENTSIKKKLVWGINS